MISLELMEAIEKALEAVFNGAKRHDTETEQQIIKAYKVVDIIRIDIKPK